MSFHACVRSFYSVIDVRLLTQFDRLCEVVYKFSQLITLFAPAQNIVFQYKGIPNLKMKEEVNKLESLELG